jgi:hypothetical protein
MQQPSGDAGVYEGIRNVDFKGQNFLPNTIEVSVPGDPVDIGHVEGERENVMQIPRGEVVGERLAVSGVDVGPADEISNCTLQKGCMLSGEKQHEYGVCDHSLVGPGVMDGGGVSGPVGPQVSHWNPFLDIEDQQAVAIHSAHIPNVEEDQYGAQLAKDVAVNEEDEVEVIGGSDVEGNGVTGAMSSSQISES